jgi:Zn-finger nucleic acid-binding protein
MKKGQYAYSSGVIIDRCESCHGIWLDRGELAKLRLFVNRPVPREKVLIAQMQAEGQRKRIEARLRREEFRHGWGGGGVERTQFDWKALFSFLRGIL